jgi:Skp family chaperone for outer membrane proteins
MNKFRLATAIFFAAIFSISAFAQSTPIKMAMINTEFFYDDKAGITKLINAQKQLDREFEVQIKTLQDGNTKLQSIANEMKTMQQLPKAQFNQVAFNSKQDEGERLQRELNYKKTELEAAIAKRREIVVSPVSRDIGRGIDEFAKKNGYGAIFDVSKLADTGALLFLADSADVTKEFITFYNARPATATTPATPK